MAYRSCAAWTAWSLCLLSPCLSGAPRAEEPEIEDGDPEPKAKLSERDERILQLFTASQKGMADGRIRLIYNFETP
jgi:hypothetical protein